MQIHPAVVEDAAAISALIRSFDGDVSAHPDGCGIEPYLASTSPEAEAGYIANPRYTYLTTFCESKLVGVVALRDRTHLFHLFIERSFQRRGIGRALWLAALTTVDPERTIGVFTVNSSLVALPVYEKFGFEPAGPKIEANGISFIPMQLFSGRASAGYVENGHPLESTIP
ncbi:MAG: GNAT family N-acetyltransferase [Betaproteobacteria bacterium]|nr:GNAT family N-acetyltransferase [Betaproteobacteria bacterium]